MPKARRAVLLGAIALADCRRRHRPPDRGSRTLGFERPEGAARQAFFAAGDPASPSYRQFLTPAELKARYGAAPAVRRAFRREARRRGLRVAIDPSGVLRPRLGPGRPLRARVRRPHRQELQQRRVRARVAGAEGPAAPAPGSVQAARPGRRRVLRPLDAQATRTGVRHAAGGTRARGRAAATRPARPARTPSGRSATPTASTARARAPAPPSRS